MHKDSSYCIAANIHYAHPQDSIGFYITINKENTIDWNYSEGSSETVDGWNYNVGNNVIYCTLIEQDRLIILPIEFSGEGKLTITIYIEASQTGHTQAQWEIFLE